MKKTFLLVLVLALGLPAGVANADFTFGTPTNLGPTVNTSVNDLTPRMPADGLSLYFASNRGGGSGGYDLWLTTRPTTSDPWGTPVNLGPTVNSSANEWALGISADGQTLYVASNRPGGYGSLDIWTTRRTTTNDDWGEPVNLGPMVNSSAIDGYPAPSADGRTLYFSSNRPGGAGGVDLWQIPMTPIVDFNGDGIVDAADMCIMVDYWGTDESLCDIAPMPWGDGIVDVQDLIVLAEHLFEDVDDPTLVAHWALDEIEGDIASDSANDNDGTVYGDPAWQPEGGMVDGALQLDGIDDYVNTPLVLNPADGPFSVFVWIKGGAPGQVILSQESGVNWLAADAVDGALKTDLRTPEENIRSPIPPGPPLISPTVVTDGDWHRVGFVRDGSHRILYVDDIEVACDTATNLESASGGLYIGAGSDLEPGAFWSGLIDDVRIYNRALTP